MTEAEFKSRFPNASQSTIAKNCPSHRLQNPEPKQDSFGANNPKQSSGEKESQHRFTVSIKSLRSRLCDADNLYVKALVDAVRYAKLIPDDSPAHIDLVVSQQKVAKGEECTIVSITENI